MERQAGGIEGKLRGSRKAAKRKRVSKVRFAASGENRRKGWSRAPGALLLGLGEFHEVGFDEAVEVAVHYGVYIAGFV